ncbi:MAG: hypothetical protein SPM02_07955 [Bacteroidales bacterium]|nr:hypothetical protein [Bacteroidales bacterium]
MKLKFMKHTTLAILAAAVTIALASCEKTPVEPENPNPVDNPIYSSGIADQVVEFLTNEQGDTTAFQISYTSWIEVDGEKVSVPLKVYFRVLDTIFYVPVDDGYYIYNASMGYKKYSERRDGAVTIIDSAAYATFDLKYYSFVLECTYQAAISKVGNGHQTMPYLRVEQIDSPKRVIKNDILYVVCRITVNGEEYFVPSRITEVWPLQ